MRFLLHSALAVTALVSTTQAEELFVRADLTAGMNDGSSWEDAFQGSGGLQLALAAATSGDDIYVAQGTYFAALPPLTEVSFVLLAGVRLFGGFEGDESSLAERPAFGAFPSILDGNISENESEWDNSRHVVRGGTSDSSAVLDGFVIRGGYAAPGGPNDGAGLYCTGGANPTVRNCEFRENRAIRFGSGIHFEGGAAIVTDCRFVENIGGSIGGGLFASNMSQLHLDRCVFIGNDADSGGGVYMDYVEDALVSNCLFAGNVASSTSAGGAMTVELSSLLVVNCTVVGNQTWAGAEAGIRLNDITGSVTNSIFWNNATLAGNQGPGNQVTLGNTVTHSIVKGTYAGTGNINQDPLFVDSAGGDFRLTLASAAVDSGNNAGLPSQVTTDADNLPRKFDVLSVPDTGLGMAPIVDRGAFEARELLATSFCFGDGSGALCPCGNSAAPSQGCANSTGVGATLTPTGSSSVSADDLAFTATSIPPNQPALLFLGQTQIMGGSGVTFGDGLRCIGAPTMRLGVRFASAGGTASWPSGLASAGGLSAGLTTYFQAWYRDVTGPCGAGFNTTQGVGITAAP